MFPYNKAINRSIRGSKRKNRMEESKPRPEIADGITEEDDILWDLTEYKLSYVLDNFKLPQIVRVVEGFMFTEEDSLASGTILTIHGQQKVEQICAIDRNGQGNDIFIPLSCPYKVKVTVPDRGNIYRTVKDLCNATPLPKCVVVHEKVAVGGVKIPSGRMLIVKSISKNRDDQAEGISVELLDGRIRNLVLPLKIIGNFAPCPLPTDQNRTYFVRELSERSFPLWVTFQSSFERNPPYGPHMGIVKFTTLQTTHIVFSTSVIDQERFAISFSRDLPVTVEMARGMLHGTQTYSNRCRVAQEQIDIDVLSHLTDTNPYSDKYQSAIYADVCALRKAFQQQGIVENTRDSSESFQSDTSCSEDVASLKETRYVIDKTFPKNGSATSSRKTIDSRSNHSTGSTNDSESKMADSEYSSPHYTYCDIEANRALRSSGEDLEDEAGYMLIAERMDYPFASIKQKGTKNISRIEPYLSTEIRAHSPTLVLKDSMARIPPPPDSPKSTTPLPPRRSKRKSKSASSVQNGEPYSSRVSLDRALSENSSSNEMPSLNRYVSETLSHGSGESDAESIASDYHSVKSESSLVLSTRSDQTKEKRCPPKKPERPKGPPRPIPRKSSLKKYSDEENTNTNSICPLKDSETAKANGNIVLPAEGFNDDSPAPGSETLDKVDGVDTVHWLTSDSNMSDSNMSDSLDVGLAATDKSSDEENLNPDPKRVLDPPDCATNLKVSKETSKHVLPSNNDNLNTRHASPEERRSFEAQANPISDDSECFDQSEHTTDLKMGADVPSEEKSLNTVENEVVFNENEDGLLTEQGFSVADADEEGICRILDEIQLSDFKEIFRDEQINGSLLEGLDTETLRDLGLDQFQAVKLLDFVKGWRPNETGTSDSNEPNLWTTKDVLERLQKINLKSLAEFCAKTQVDGKLLQSLIDNEALECLTKIYSVELNKFNKIKLIRYVKQGWRPDNNK